MKKRIFPFVLVGIFISMLILNSCDNQDSCYNDQLYQEHKNDFCPTDCPGVIGCDGEIYCNSCVANKLGISVD